MFSGIVETTSRAKKITTDNNAVQINIEKPSDFNDLSIGDSVAVNGLCLTVEAFNDSSMEFTIAAESLHITNWSSEELKARPLNLERPIKLSDRVHGHFVLGHVDGLAKVVKKKWEGASLFLGLELPEKYRPFVWPKGSITLNGVSLTVNKVTGVKIEVCLIPETIKRTNMAMLELGDLITFEVDSMARAFVHMWSLEKENV